MSITWSSWTSGYEIVSETLVTHTLDWSAGGMTGALPYPYMDALVFALLERRYGSSPVPAEPSSTIAGLYPVRGTLPARDWWVSYDAHLEGVLTDYKSYDILLQENRLPRLKDLEYNEIKAYAASQTGAAWIEPDTLDRGDIFNLMVPLQRHHALRYVDLLSGGGRWLGGSRSKRVYADPETGLIDWGTAEWQYSPSSGLERSYTIWSDFYDDGIFYPRVTKKGIHQTEIIVNGFERSDGRRLGTTLWAYGAPAAGSGRGAYQIPNLTFSSTTPQMVGTFTSSTSLGYVGGVGEPPDGEVPWAPHPLLPPLGSVDAADVYYITALNCNFIMGSA